MTDIMYDAVRESMEHARVLYKLSVAYRNAAAIIDEACRSTLLEIGPVQQPVADC